MKKKPKVLSARTYPSLVAPALYKVVIQKLVLGKSHPSAKELQNNRRVIVVEASMIKGTPDDIRDRLSAFGAFDGQYVTNEIVSITPTERPFVVLAS